MDAPQPPPTYDGIILPSFEPLTKDCEKRIKEIIGYDCRDSDILLCTYPKSGTHWSWEIITMILNGKTELTKEEKITMMMEFVPDLKTIDDQPSPRLLNSHLPARFLPVKQIENNYKIIHVVRNPKDIFVSYWNHMKQDPVAISLGIADWNVAFEKCLKGEVPFGSWFEYVKAMEKMQKSNPNFLLIYYEDMHKNPKTVMHKIASFVGRPINQELIESIMKATSFSNMSKNKPDFSKQFTPDGTGFIYRKGVVGDWRNHFTDEHNKRFQQIFDKEMANTGYKIQYD